MVVAASPFEVKKSLQFMEQLKKFFQCHGSFRQGSVNARAIRRVRVREQDICRGQSPCRGYSLVAKGRCIFVTEDLLATTGDSQVPRLPDEMKCEAHGATYEAFLPKGYSEPENTSEI